MVAGCPPRAVAQERATSPAGRGVSARPRGCRHRPAGPLLCGLLAAAAPRAALAAGEDPLSAVTLEYVAPEGCGSEGEVLGKLRAAL
ncbi:MAG TPA: hypothetical protein PLU22_21090, partial [Polyangiaceae bacterium]|nr:hypothetical protein [Polyangiaceae bacterium]